MKKHLFLSKDYELLEQLVQSRLQEYRHFQNEMSVAADQTNETWHDNFGFEDSNRQLHRLGSEIESLVKTLENSQIIPLPNQTDFIQIGHTVTYEIGNSVNEIKIGSHLTFSDQEISYESPLAKLLMNKSITNQIVWNGQILTILKIQ